MRYAVPLVALALLAAGSTSAAVFAHYPGGGGKDCKSVTYTPNSDDVAADIQADGISCKKARKIVKAWDKGDSEPKGFECQSRGRGSGDPGHGLGHTDVRCEDGRRQVTWARY